MSNPVADPATDAGVPPHGSAGQSFVGLRFAQVTIDEAVRRVVARGADAPFDYVVTPNVDHVVRLHDGRDQPELQRSYRDAFLCLCDSQVLGHLARLAGVRLSVVTGSDLVARLLADTLAPGDRLTLIGGDDVTLARLRRLLPGTAIAQHQPPMGLLDDEEAMARCVAFAEAHPARYVLLAVGSPQQELVAHRIRASGRASGAGLCVGAAIEFLTGKVARAPRWMRRGSLEWLHRLLHDPAGLWRRYLVRCPRIVRIILREHVVQS